MIVKLYSGGEEINRIVVDGEDWLAGYCAENGYTYELEPDPEPGPEPEPAYTADDLFAALLGN